MRVGLGVRLRAIRESARQRDPRAYALYHLDPKLRRWHAEWEAECRQIAADRYGDDPASRYAAMLDGDEVFPPMPLPVAKALNSKPAPSIPVTATVEEAAEMYRRFLCYEGD